MIARAFLCVDDWDISRAGTVFVLLLVLLVVGLLSASLYNYTVLKYPNQRFYSRA